jgi:hypothetical protein
VTRIRNAASGIITLLVRNNGVEEVFSVERTSVPEFKARKAAYITVIRSKTINGKSIQTPKSTM